MNWLTCYLYIKDFFLLFFCVWFCLFFWVRDVFLKIINCNGKVGLIYEYVYKRYITVIKIYCFLDKFVKKG